MIAFLPTLLGACGGEAEKTENTTTGSTSGLFEDFEDNNISDWTESIPGALTYTFEAGATGAGSSLRISGNASVHPDGIEKVLTNTNPTYISFHVKNVTTALAGGYFFLTNGPNLGIDDGIYFMMKNNGFMGPFNNWTYAYTANTWYFVEFKNIDFVNFTFDYYVDGVLQNSAVPFRYPISSFTNLYLYNYETTSSWFDDIDIQ
ncbi:MAG: hypothetical protein OEZ59_09105 [Deltaproteobacteria bacterium]|nr:hypothetical protein [Deltaproteobacteria bacterium]